MKRERAQGPGGLPSVGRPLDDGFSLVEWLISIVLLAMLAAGGFMLFQVVANTSERSEAQSAMDEYAESIASDVRSMGWSDCHFSVATGSLHDYFAQSVAARMSPTGADPIVKPAATQAEGTGFWAVQDPVVEDVHLGAGLRASTWERVPPSAQAANPNLESCSNYFVARVTFVVRNYDPAPGAQKPSIPIEIRRQVLVTRS
jgi:prepilin-type N-terminal cleavage/methylation domain-containing protein